VDSVRIAAEAAQLHSLSPAEGTEAALLSAVHEADMAIRAVHARSRQIARERREALARPPPDVVVPPLPAAFVAAAPEQLSPSVSPLRRLLGLFRVCTPMSELRISC